MKTHWRLTWLVGLVLVVTLAGLPRAGAESEAFLSLVDTVEVGGRPGAVLVDADQERNDVLIYDRAAGQLRVLDGDSLTLVPDAIPLPTADWETWMAYDRVNYRTYALTTQRVGAYPNTWTELTVNVLSRRQVVNSFSVNGHLNSDPLNPVDTVYEVGGLAFKQPFSEGANPGRLIIDNPKQGTLDVVDLNATGIQTKTLQRHTYRAPVLTTGYRLNRGNTLALEPRHETRTPDDLGQTDLLYVADMNGALGHVRALSLNQAPNPLQVTTLPDVDLTGHWPFSNGHQGVATTGDRDLLYVASGLQSFETGYVAEVDTRTNQVNQVIELTYGDDGFVTSDWYDPRRVFVVTSDGFSYDAPDYGYYLHLIYDGAVVDTLRLADKFDGTTELEVRDVAFDPYCRRLYVTLDTRVIVVDVNYGAPAAPLPEPAPVVVSIEIGPPWYGGTLETPDGDVTFTFVNWVDQATTVTYTELAHAPSDAAGAQDAAQRRGKQSDAQYPLLMYTLEAEVNGTGETLTDVIPYYVTIRYEPSPAIESTLGLYRWISGSWVAVPGSAVDTTAKTVTASPEQMGAFAVLGETRRVFLPLVIGS
jgi:hypothetical protein